MAVAKGWLARSPAARLAHALRNDAFQRPARTAAPVGPLPPPFGPCPGKSVGLAAWRLGRTPARSHLARMHTHHATHCEPTHRPMEPLSGPLDRPQASLALLGQGQFPAGRHGGSRHGSWHSDCTAIPSTSATCTASHGPADWLAVAALGDWLLELHFWPSPSLLTPPRPRSTFILPHSQSHVDPRQHPL